MKHTMNVSTHRCLTKQSVLVVALGSLCLGSTAALADMSNSLYGNFRFSFNQVDSASQDGMSGDNNASRLGFKGEFKGSDLTAFYHLEAGANNDAGGETFSSRFYYAGLRGGFGSVVAGRHSPAYKMPGVHIDPFYDTSANGAGGTFGSGGATYGLSGLTNGFANNALAYSTPKLGDALTLNAGVYVDDGDDDKHNYGVGATYASGPITAGIQYFDAGNGNASWTSANNLKAYRLHAAYKDGPMSLGLSYENVESKAAGAQDINYLYLAGSYNISETTRLSASVGNVDEGANEGTGFNIGVFHNVFKNTTIYGLYSTVDRDDNVDADVFSVGMIYSFNVGF
jgi:hypothetical protein